MAETRVAGVGAAASAGDTDSEQQVVGFARGGGLNLIGAVCNQAALLGVTILIARRLGRADVGAYAQAYAFLALLGPLSMAGLSVGLTRFVAVHLAEQDTGAVRGTVRLGITIATISAGALGAALFAAAPWLVREAFHDPRLIMALRFVGLTMPAAAFTDAALSATQGYRTMKPFALIGLMLESALLMALVAVMLLLGMGLRGVMAALLASTLVTAALAGVALRRVMGAPTAPPTYRPRELLGFSTMSWMAGLASTGLIWADIVLLGLFRSSAEVGVYNVSTRLVHLATFVMLPINAAFAPRVAELYHRGRTESLRRTYGLATSWIIRLSLPAFVLLVVFPRDLLRFFGRGFAIGAAVTVILAVGKLVDAATGPCGMMLNMSGRPTVNVLDNTVGLVVNILLNLLLIPRYGIIGSAVAWAVSLVVVNLARVTQVWLALHMLPVDAGVLKGLVAGAGAFVAALLVRDWMQPSMAGLVGAAAIVVVYLGVLVLQGLTVEDRLILASLFRRRLPSTRMGPQSRRMGPRPPMTGPWTRPPVSPARYVRALWRRHLVVLAGLSVGMLFGAAVLPAVLPSQPTYRATVRIDLEPFVTDPASATATSPPGRELAASVLDVDIATKLVPRLGSLPTQLRATRHLPPELWPSGLIAGLRARAVPGSRSAVELSLVDGSAGRAGRVLSAYAQRYASKRNLSNKTRTRQALSALERQTGELWLNMERWGQQVDQERGSSPTGTPSTPTRARFEAFRDRYRAMLAEQERLRGLAAMRGPVTVPRLPPTLRQASAPLGRTRTTALGGLVGVLAAAILALLLEAFRPRLLSPADATLATGLDVLASVPMRRRRPIRRRARQEGLPGVEAEEYRRIALALDRRGLGSELLVLAVASADPGEGRSTVVAGLAEALQGEGRGVLVVSGDLHRPVIERFLGVPARPGLAESLDGLGVDVTSRLVSVRGNLLLLPAGRAGQNVVNQLTRPDLARAMEELRRLSVVVLVDTPPARWCADALALVSVADATVLVAQRGRSHWKAVSELAAALRRDRFPVLGVVLVGASRVPGRHRRR